MTSQTAKYQLVVAESGDGADMPTYTTAAQASVEAALDRVLNQANAVANTKVSKTGDTMTGQLTIKATTGYSHTKYMLPSSGFWVGTDPGAGDSLTVAGLTASGAFDRQYMAFNPAGEVVVPAVAVFTGGLRIAAPVVGNSTGLSWVLIDGQGTCRSITDTTFRLIVAAIGQTSTRRVKKNIGTPSGTPDITALQPKAYTWTDEAFAQSSPGTRYGLIAEDVAEVDPRLVTVDADGKVAGLDSHALIAALVAEVTALQTRLDDLEGRTT